MKIDFCGKAGLALAVTVVFLSAFRPLEATTLQNDVPVFIDQYTGVLDYDVDLPIDRIYTRLTLNFKTLKPLYSGGQALPVMTFLTNEGEYHPDFPNSGNFFLTGYFPSSSFWLQGAFDDLRLRYKYYNRSMVVPSLGNGSLVQHLKFTDTKASFYKIAVPAGASSVMFTIKTASGFAVVDVIKPDDSVDIRIAVAGMTNKIVTETAAAGPGDYIASLSGTYGDLSLRASYIIPGTGTHTLAVSANPATAGWVSGGGTFQDGTVRTVTATPKPGYLFGYWSEDWMWLNNTPSYTFTLDRNLALVANFIPDPASNFTVSVSASPEGWGKATGGGTFFVGSSCTVTAAPADGYTFAYWSEDRTWVSSNPRYTFTVDRDRNLKANFSAVLPNIYTIKTWANPDNWGQVAGAGSYEVGTFCTVTAAPWPGYMFEYWTDKGIWVSGSPSYTFRVKENRNLVATFMPEGHTNGNSRICFADPSYTGNEGEIVKVLVNRIGSISGSVSVSYSVKAGTALPWRDYMPRSGTLYWTDGQSMSKPIKIPIYTDWQKEGTETFTVVLDNPIGAVLANPFKAQITIPGNTKGGGLTTDVQAGRMENLAGALGCPELALFTSPQAPWKDANALPGRPAAVSESTIGLGRISWLQAEMDGSGTLSFDWMLQGEPAGGVCLLLVDGHVRGTLLAGYDWAPVALTLGEGLHTARWVFVPSPLHPSAAYLSRVRWE